MCKFCKKIKSTKKVTKVSHKGNKYYVEEPCEINPSLEDAEWGTITGSSMGREIGAPFDCVLNVDTKEIEFEYDPYCSDSYFDATLKINYCPFCGRKL